MGHPLVAATTQNGTSFDTAPRRYLKKSSSAYAADVHSNYQIPSKVAKKKWDSQMKTVVLAALASFHLDAVAVPTWPLRLQELSL
jgi:hypothetical protein